MRKVIFYSITLLVLVACGGGPGTPDDPSDITDSIADINLTQAIRSNNIPNYDDTDPIENQYLSVLNYLRHLSVKCNDGDARRGPVDSLAWNDVLARAADEHSKDMLSNKSMQHGGSGLATDITAQEEALGRGSIPSERVSHNGYVYSMTGENVAYAAAYPTLSNTAWLGAMEGLMRSTDGHCSNIMNPNFKDFAMVEARGSHDVLFNDGITRRAPAAYWTQSFGAPR